MAGVDWHEDATLYLHLALADGGKTTRAVEFGPLHRVLALAISGRHGPLEGLLIETESGLEIAAGAIADYARRSGEAPPR
ncbi:MAG TPA: hypothetical protein VG819_11075 [Rhizomicrobium sp.]|nr:hypothetical protein [Rhizomicrobium sp.]